MGYFIMDSINRNLKPDRIVALALIGHTQGKIAEPGGLALDGKQKI